MITKDNFHNLLEDLGFQENETNILSKTFHNNLNCVMSVDFNTQKLVFPEQVRGRERNTVFDEEHKENMVVFECVTRLLDKGYRPEHIELEKVWTLGHEQKSGRADVIVYQPESNDVLLIIECKTAGREFDNAWKDTQADGGQVFSYWQQERSAQWLALYASDYADDKVSYKCHTICCSDDANIKLVSKNDDSIKLYEKAYSAREKFEVWQETYNGDFYNNLIFGEDNTAYKIGIKPLRKKDLIDFKPEDKIVNRFEEILRHNNVSDKENAFNRLIALFICKLVDEIKKQDFEEVEFQYKQGSDTYESLQDRLQRLHKEGMEEFMKEKIFYVSADYAKDLFQQYTGRQRKAAIEDLNNTIRILKFYSNNDFAFKDVHNEELFYQNGKILVEMVTLFQSYRIVYPSKHQFLGDLFEQLLNKGFKQNEGQFFTPTPITRFIWDCLPLQNYISECGLPRVIDYACGAGHFLTEAVEAINAVRKDAENSWVEKHIYGIEKDYRLARVSKISMFMNGAGGSQIIFGDGLENYTEKSIENGTFDILVANPPYSVSAFKSHLKLKNNSFDILNKISNDGSEIETLFVERIAQLLKPKGIAAVVLPSSILSNNSGSYEAAREKILSHFLLRSIVCFGSKTFGATGTNTVVLYLEKYDEPPVQMKLADDVADAILKGDVNDEWEDANVLDTYVRKIEVEKDVYLKFAKEEYSLNEIKTLNYFREYVEAFNPNAQKYPKKLTDEERQSEELRRFYAFVKNIEFQKVKFFALVHKQNTLVITAPADNAQQKAFLGYDWSNRKGAEGIVINQKGGKLYNDSDRFARGTLACAVRNTFADATTTIADDLAQYTVYYSLADMLDFSRTTFDKSIKTKAQKKEEIKSKYDLVKIGAYLFENRKSEIQVNQAKENKNGLYPFFTSGLTVYRHDDFLVDGENIYMATGGNATIQYYNGKSSYSTDTWVIRSSDEGKLSTYYLYLLLQERVQEINNDYFKGTGLKHLQKPDFKQIQIPLPPLDIQQQIVTECSAIDTAREDAVKKIVDLKKEIESTMSSVKGEIVSIAKIGQIKMCKRIMKYETSSSGDIPFYKIGTFGNVADSFITKEKFDEYKTLYPYPKKGQVLISAAGTIGKSILFDGEPAYFQDSNIVWIDNNEEIVLNNYLYRCLQFVDWSKYETNGGIIKRLYNDNLRNTQITAPSLTEQQAIVSKIEKIETEIAALQNTINESAGKKSEILKKWLE